MLRVERDPNGTFNTTEFGSVTDADQFRALWSYSPYHRVKDGAPYPAILFLTGENDHRVNPMQSRKMTARLQAATASNQPVFLRTASSAGHGMGTSLNEGIEQEADVLAFLFDQLGIRYSPPRAVTSSTGGKLFRFVLRSTQKRRGGPRRSTPPS
jgi:prolyl oligopeptidase